MPIFLSIQTQGLAIALPQVGDKEITVTVPMREKGLTEAVVLAVLDQLGLKNNEQRIGFNMRFGVDYVQAAIANLEKQPEFTLRVEAARKQKLTMLTIAIRVGSSLTEEIQKYVSESAARKPLSGMTTTEKIGEAMRRAIPMLPAEAQEQIKAMLTPEALAIIAGTLIIWAASHFFGVGEVVDIILLVAGVAFIGPAVFTGAEEFYNFVTTAINAMTEGELDRAAQHFAKAVNILGITVISAILLKKNVNSVISRGRPQIRPMPNIGPPTPRGVKITRPFRLPSGALGETDFFGNIQVIRKQPIIEQRLTLYHEWVHSILSPRFGPLRQLRAQLRASAYNRSSLLRYIEEAMAESYAQLRIYGLQNILVGIRFPIQGGYMTVSQIVSERIAVGNITIGGMRFTTYVTQGVFSSESK